MDETCSKSSPAVPGKLNLKSKFRFLISEAPGQCFAYLGRRLRVLGDPTACDDKGKQGTY